LMTQLTKIEFSRNEVVIIERVLLVGSLQLTHPRTREEEWKDGTNSQPVQSTGGVV